MFACALAIVVFSPADWLPPIGFSWAPLVIRLEWAAALVATALGLRRADARRTRGLLNLLAVATAALYAALVQQTGGAASPLFQWSVAMPAIVALVVQGHASAVVACGATLIPCGIAILGVHVSTPMALAQWTVQVMVVTGVRVLRVVDLPARAGARAGATATAAAIAPAPASTRRTCRRRACARPRRRWRRATNSWPSPRTSCARR